MTLPCSVGRFIPVHSRQLDVKNGLLSSPVQWQKLVKAFLMTVFGPKFCSFRVLKLLHMIDVGYIFHVHTFQYPGVVAKRGKKIYVWQCFDCAFQEGADWLDVRAVGCCELWMWWQHSVWSNVVTCDRAVCARLFVVFRVKSGKWWIILMGGRISDCDCCQMCSPVIGLLVSTGSAR